MDGFGSKPLNNRNISCLIVGLYDMNDFGLLFCRNLRFFTMKIFFEAIMASLNASLHLYNGVCPSVPPLVGWSVRQWVGPSVSLSVTLS